HWLGESLLVTFGLSKVTRQSSGGEENIVFIPPVGGQAHGRMSKSANPQIGKFANQPTDCILFREYTNQSIQSHSTLTKLKKHTYHVKKTYPRPPTEIWSTGNQRKYHF